MYKYDGSNLLIIIIKHIRLEHCDMHEMNNYLTGSKCKIRSECNVCRELRWNNASECGRRLSETEPLSVTDVEQASECGRRLSETQRLSGAEWNNASECGRRLSVAQHLSGAEVEQCFRVRPTSLSSPCQTRSITGHYSERLSVAHARRVRSLVTIANVSQ